MALTVKRAGADEYGLFIKALVLGPPGAGKTRTASTWPNVLYANCEGGLMSVADRAPAAIDITASGQMKELIDILGQKPNIREKMLGVPAETVVIDTLDEYAKILMSERLRDERKDAFSQPDWGWFGDQLRNTVRALRNLDINVIFNVHIKESSDSETGRTFFKPAIQGSMADELAAYVDLALLLVARPTVRVVNNENVRQVARYFQTYQDAQHTWVKDRSGKLPMEFTVNFDDDFDRLHKLIYGSLPSASTTVGEVATPPAVETPPPPSSVERKGAASPSEGQATIPAADPPAPAPAPEASTPPAPEPEVSTPAAADAPAPAAPEPAPAAEPEPTPAPEPEPSPEPVVTPPEPAETVPEDGTTSEAATSTAVEAPAAADHVHEDWETCAGCGGTVENKDQADLSFIRYKEHLCRSCFAERKKAKR